MLTVSAGVLYIFYLPYEKKFK